MSRPPVLYCGDTSLETAAAYLAGVLSIWNIGFDYVPSDKPLSVGDVADRKLVILSDYPSAMAARETQLAIVEHVRAGCGLLMVGGWESFTGSAGHWRETPVAEILPVEMSKQDDRVQGYATIAVRFAEGHSLIAGMAQIPGTCVAGVNRVVARPQALTLATAWCYSLSNTAESPAFSLVDRHPLLVSSEFGLGRTVAWTSDFAPHWVGSMVDWGNCRIVARAPGANEVEVGDAYAKWLRDLVIWTGRIEEN